MEAIDFYSLDRPALASFLMAELSLPAFRAEQIFQWVYRERLEDFDKMSNISKELRSKLRGIFVFPKLAARECKVSNDGTRKYVFEVDNGDFVETVMIKQPKRMTLCLSSQVGCAMGCHFCKTATMKLKRHLSTSEIVRQVLAVIDDAKNYGDMFQNIVFMGMGEPLHNFDPVTTALKILKDDFGLGLSGRKITVSSVGLVPAIEKFGQSGIEANLAISLNATSDEIRSQIMPINKRFPIAELLKCLREFPLKRRKRITIEYVMLAGVNDTAEDLKRLPKLLQGIPSKVNLIPYNNNAGLGFESPSRDWIGKWQKELMGKGLETTIRWSKGKDIDAACGQLVTTVVKKIRTPARLALAPASSAEMLSPIAEVG